MKGSVQVVLIRFLSSCYVKRNSDVQSFYKPLFLTVRQEMGILKIYKINLIKRFGQSSSIR